MLRRVFRTTVSIILVLTVLVNIQIPALQAYASERTSSATLVQSQMNGWNTSSTLSSSGTMNGVPDSAVQQSNAARKPDIGEEVDNTSNIWTWIEDLFTKDTYVRSEGENSVAAIYEDIVDNGIKVSNGNEWVDLVPVDGCFDTVAATDCAVRFTDVFDGVDYQFSAVDGSAQVKLIYEGISENNDFGFSLDCAKDLSIVNKDGGFVVTKNEKPIFILSSPVAYDAGGAMSDASFVFDKTGKLVVSADKEWLKDLSRAYPVAIGFSLKKYNIDMPIVIDSAPAKAAASSGGITPSVDNNFDMGTATLSGISGEIPEGIEAEYYTIYDVEGGAISELIPITSNNVQIDIGSLEKEKIYCLAVVVGDQLAIIGEPFLIYEYTAEDPLEEGAVYSIPYAYGADAGAFISDNGIADNMLLCANSTLFVRNPSEGGSKPIGAPAGEYLEELRAWLFGQGISNFVELGLEPINYNTGNFVYSAIDVVLPDYNGELTIGRTYNSLGAKVGGSFGYGWEFAYDITLCRIKGGAFIMSLGDGRTVWFRNNGSTFVANEGMNYTWKRTGSGYEITDDATKTIYCFNKYGILTRITDSSGRSTTFTYDSNRKLSSFTNSAGYTVNVKCDSRGRIQKITFPNGGVKEYKYDKAYNLISVTDQEGRTTKYTYDNAHRLLTVTNPEGTVTVDNTYDSQGRVVKQLDANGNAAALSYEKGKTTVTDNNGNITQVYYDDLYRTLKVIFPNGSTELKTWDNANNMLSYTDMYGNPTFYSYNNDGLVTEETRADGATAKYSYNASNKTTSYTDYAGNTTLFEYDSNNNLISATYADGSSVSYTYNNRNQLTKVTDKLGNTNLFEYTGALCTAHIDALGNRTEYGYSIMGWLTAVKDAEENITRYLYNACGERYAEQRPDGSMYTYVYDDAGYVTAIVDELGYTSTFSYDQQGNLTMGVDPLGNTLNKTYDGNYNELTSADALGQTTSYTYDSMDRVTTVTDANGGTTAYVYDAAGNVIAVTDPNGNTANLTYNTILGVTASVTEPGDRTTSFEYDLMGNITKVTYADGSAEYFEYDKLYRLIRTVSVLGLVTEYTYDAAGNVIEVSNSENQKFTYTYDANGNVLSVTDAIGSTTTYTYNSLGYAIAVTDAAGLTSTVEYDCMGRPVVLTDAAGGTITYEYDLRGDVTAVTDAKGNRSELYYNELGNLIASKDALGYVTTYEYDAVEQLTATIDALTNKTQLEYDSNGNLTSMTEANGASTKLSYDKNGNNTKIVDAEGYVTTVEYNFADQIVKTISPTGLEKYFTYDSMSRIVKATDSTGGFIEYTYDAAGNVLTETDATGRVVRNTYDTLGRLVSATGYDGETYTYTYDALSRVTTITDPEGKVTSYEYDYRNNLVKVTEFDGAVYSYEYDALNRLIKSTNPIGAVVSYEYDALGNLIRSTDAEGNVTSVDYDALSRITAVTEANGGVTSYTYDAVGNVLSATSPLGNISEYQYDSVYNLIAYKDSEDYVTTYAYDLVGNLTSTTSARNAVTQYEYDGAGNVTKMTDAKGYVTAYDYMSNGMLTMLTQANGGTYTYEYDILNRVTKITDPEGYFRAFTYDENGDVVSETDSLEISNTYAYDLMHRMTASGEEGIITTYTYDARGNLAGVVMPNNGTYTYTYDAIDRLSAMTDPLGLDVAYSYNLNNQILSETKENVATTGYAYDSMGNNVSVTDPMGAVSQFVYDVENNLTTSTDHLGYSISVQYDALGRNIGMVDQMGKDVGIIYDPHDNIIGLVDANNQTTAYTYDLVDNLTGIVDANGATVSYAYDSMGNLTTATNGNGNTSAYTYNLRGDLTSVTNPMGEVEQYRYDIAGKLTEYVKPSGITVSYDYDKLNNLVSKEVTNEEPVAYAYDNMGFRVEMNDAVGDVSYEYDAVGNATKVVHHNGETVRYSYDVFGRLSEIMYPDGYCTNYEYDLCDRLVKVIGRDSGVTTYEYDANGNVLLCDRSNGTYTTYTYNARGELINLENRRDSGALLSSYAYEYDRNGFITKETEKVDSYTYVREYIYDAVGQLVGYTETTNGKTTATYSYTYDNAGNRVGMVYYDASNTKYWTNYVYNENNELISETYNYNKSKKKVISTETTYTYDTDGNLITKDADGDIWQYLWTSESRLEAVVNGGTLLMAATYDGVNNRIFQISDAASSSKVHQDSSLKSEWKSENGNSYPWENGNGNGGNGTGHSNTGNGGCTNGGGHNHTGNNSDGLKHANCKQCVDTQEAFVQTLADDAVSIDGTDYLPVGKPNSYKDYELIYYINDVTIDNEEVLVEYGAAGTATGTYEYGLQRLSVEHVNEAKEYYLYNGTGNVTQTTSENGSMFLRYTYDPFGNVTSINAPMTVDIDDLNRYTYNGEDYDYNTGLQYLRARYYSTNTGNFISQDTFLGSALSGLSQNRYTYVGNSPIMYSDPSGHWGWFDDLVEGAGNLWNSATEAISDVYNDAKDFVVDTYNDAKAYVDEKLDEAEDALRNAGCVAEILADNVVDQAKQTINTVVDMYHNSPAEFWTFVGSGVAVIGATAVGAIFPAAAPLTGAVVSAGMDLCGQMLSGTKVDEINWGHVALSGTTGLVTGFAGGGAAKLTQSMLKSGASTLSTLLTSSAIMGGTGALTGGGMEYINQLQIQRQYEEAGLEYDINWSQIGVRSSGGFLSGTIQGMGISNNVNCRGSSGLDSVLDIVDVGLNFSESTAYGLAGGKNLNQALLDGSSDALNGIVTDMAFKSIGAMAEKTCFVAGTMILTSTGLVAIEDIEAGDIVIATDPETGETAEKEVVETYVRETNDLVHVWVNGEEIITTPTHPFYVPEKGWTDAIDLRAGDILVLVNGEYVIVEKIQHEITEVPVTVYNFQVADFHTYYASEQSVLVHNADSSYSNAGESGNSSTLFDTFGVQPGRNVDLNTPSAPDNRSYITYIFRNQSDEIVYVGRASGNGNPVQVMEGRISKGHDHFKPGYSYEIVATQSNKLANQGAEEFFILGYEEMGMRLENITPSLSYRSDRVGKTMNKIEAFFEDLLR